MQQGHLGILSRHYDDDDDDDDDVDDILLSIITISSIENRTLLTLLVTELSTTAFTAQLSFIISTMSGYVLGTFSEAEREDYTEVDVDPPAENDKEMGFQDLALPETESILPSQPADEQKEPEEDPDWAEDEVETVIHTEIEELQSSPPLSTEAPATSKGSRFQPRLQLTKPLEESSEAEGNPSPLNSQRAPMPKIAEKRTLSEKARKRGGASKKPERKVQEVSSQTPVVKAPPSIPPSQSSTQCQPSSSPRPPSIKPLTSPSTSTRQPLRPLSTTRAPDPAPSEVASYEEPDWPKMSSFCGSPLGNWLLILLATKASIFMWRRTFTCRKMDRLAVILRSLLLAAFAETPQILADGLAALVHARPKARCIRFFFQNLC